MKTLPGYAPELNPDEGVWGWSKYGRLANLAAMNTQDLRQRVTQEPEFLNGGLKIVSFSRAAISK